MSKPIRSYPLSICFLFRNLEEILDLQLKLKEEQQYLNQLKVSKDLELEGIKTSEGQLREINEQLKIDMQRYVRCWLLVHFWPMLPFYTPAKHQKTNGFLVFWGV